MSRFAKIARANAEGASFDEVEFLHSQVRYCHFVSTTTAVVILAAAAAASAYATYQAGQDQKKIAGRQAEAMNDRARYEREIAAANEAAYRKKTDRLLASQRAAFGAAGVDFAGTALDVSEETAGEAELQAQRIRSGGEATAIQLGNQANLTRWSGEAGARTATIRAGATALGGAARASSLYKAGPDQSLSTSKDYYSSNYGDAWDNV